MSGTRIEVRGLAVGGGQNFNYMIGFQTKMRFSLTEVLLLHPLQVEAPGPTVMPNEGG